MTSPALPRKNLHITAAAVPLAGWTAHTVVLHRRLAAAQRDLLTGTLRREPFLARAQRILERHLHDAVLILADADHFKALNDTFGHAAGDTALAAIGTRLTEWAGKRGTVGRLGGDEFAAVTRIRPRHQALRLEHLARLLAQPVTYDGEQLPLAVSAGFATPARQHPPVTGSGQRLLVWRDSCHFNRWEDASCVLCDRPTPLRSHKGEAVHKVCAED